jgi:hypothetical protein
LVNEKQRFIFLTETTGFTFRFQETEDIVFTNGTLDVTDNGTVGIVHEFNADLGDTTTRTGTAENLSNSSELDGGLRRRVLHFLISKCQYINSQFNNVKTNGMMMPMIL